MLHEARRDAKIGMISPCFVEVVRGDPCRPWCLQRRGRLFWKMSQLTNTSIAHILTMLTREGQKLGSRMGVGGFT